jgi:phosphoglycerate dehydrogenase-like enzyme
VSKPIVYIHRIGHRYSLYMPPENEALLRSFADIAFGGQGRDPVPPEQVVASMRGASAILSLNGSGATDVTLEVLNRVGTVQVAVISHWSHGLHEAARQMWEAAGVEVIDASDANTEAVAEWTLAAMLMGVRRLLEYDRELKAGSAWGEPRHRAGLLCESVVGLVGLGRIGQQVARLLRAFDATVIAYDPYVSPQIANAIGARLVSLEELMRRADVISFHLPVTDATRGMFGAREFSWIKDGAVVVNSARSALFQDQDFVAAVKSGRFAAFLDVFEVEPLPRDHPFRALDNVFITPHIAGDNAPMFARCGRKAIDVLRAYLAGNETG